MKPGLHNSGPDSMEAARHTPSHWLPAVAIGAGWVSLLTGPPRNLTGSSTLVLTLSALCGLGCGILAFRFFQELQRNRCASGWPLTAVLGWLHLPFLLIWFLPLPFPESPGARPHLWVVGVTGTAIVVTLAVVMGSGLRHWCAVTASITALIATLIAHHLQSSATPIAALLWGVYLLASLIGWGSLAEKMVDATRDANWGQRATWGMAFLIVVGGLLNLSWSISVNLILGILAVGFGLWVGQCRFRRPQPTAWSRATLIWALLAVCAGVQLLSSAGGTINTVYEQPAFDLHDDQQAYLVFPIKMLDLGSIGPEPFEARRMLSMGGQTFLQAMTLAVLPLRGLHLFEIGLAPILLLALVYGAGRRHKIDERLALLVGLAVLALPHMIMRGNTSAVMTGAVLMVSWFRLLAEHDGAPPPVLVALTAAALAALKSTFIPAAVVLLLVSGGAATISNESRRRACVRIGLTTALIGLFCLPWMISILVSSGTLLYPIFGKGFYGGVYTSGFSHIEGVVEHDLSTRIRACWRHLMVLLPSLLLFCCVRDRSKNRPALAILCAAIATVILLVFAGDPEISRAIRRYSFPVAAATLVSLLIAAFADSRRQRVSVSIAAGLVVSLSFIMLNQDNISRNWDQIIANLARSAQGERLLEARSRAAVEELDRAGPPGDAILATLVHPYALDFTRHQVALMSLPGMSAPPPGLPIFEGAEAVADRLLEESIPLLAYGARDDLNRVLKLSESDIRSRYPHSKMRWVMLRYHQRYHEVVEDLSTTRKRLYQDERRLLLDLRQRVTTYDLTDKPEMISGAIDEIWTDSLASIGALENPDDLPILVLRTRGWRPIPIRDEAPELRIQGRELPLLGYTGNAFSYQLAGQPRDVFNLDIRTTIFDPIDYGAAGGQLLGIDLEAIEFTTESETALDPTRTLFQSISGKILPEESWTRNGFFADFNWTNGDAIIDHLDWPITSDECELELELNPVHPWIADPDRIELRLRINGILLTPPQVRDHTFIFHLYEGLESIHRIEILSKTFIPRELGKGSDSRKLGVPVREIRIPQAPAEKNTTTRAKNRV